MKIRIMMLAATLLLAVSAGTSRLYAQSTLPGIHLLEDKAGIVSYEVQLVETISESDANRLEQALVAKEGMISAQISVTDRLLTLEVKSPIGTAHIREVIEHEGFSIAKTLDK